MNTGYLVSANQPVHSTSCNKREEQTATRHPLLPLQSLERRKQSVAILTQPIASSIRIQKQISCASLKTGFYELIKKKKEIKILSFSFSHIVPGLTNFDQYFNIC
jgi:hypothetical protein